MRFPIVVAILTSACIALSLSKYAGASESSRQASLLLEQAAQQLGTFEADQALTTLEEARASGEFLYREHLRYFELLGVANIYLERRAEALAAFDMLLALDPGYAISYTLSPKVTFVFEEARQAAAERSRSEVHLAWPSGLKLGSPVPISMQVLADPKGLLIRGVLYTRLSGETGYASQEVALPQVGQFSTVRLAAFLPREEKDETLELYLVAKDRRGDEVLVVAGPANPYRISLTYVKPEPWYRKWWVWSIGALVVAAATGLVVGIATYDEPSTVRGTFR